MNPTVFLSCVTNEFASLRPKLARMVSRTGLHVRHQEDFAHRGVLTLHKIKEEVVASDVVLHILGSQPGANAPADQAAAFVQDHPEFASRFPEIAADGGQGKITYTQWEAWFALYFGRRLCVYKVKPAAADASPPSEHEQRLKQRKFYPDPVDDLSALLEEIRITLIDLHLLTQQQAADMPCNLPYPSIGTLFKGREEFLKQLHRQLQQRTVSAIVARQAIHGLGGVGKTRLAVEYAWSHQDVYTALLFVGADTAATFRQNLATLCGPLVLNLTEQSQAEEEVQVAAALRWLRAHPGWFLIIDNVDTPEAAEEVERILAGLHAGHVCITSRIADWSGAVEPLELDVLDPASAEAFLLDRTAGRRRVMPTDDTDASNLAGDLGQLALALEQAGAFIYKFRCSLAEYRERWLARETTVREWYDAKLMKYPRSVAVTWDTSFAQLDPGGQALLRMLCWFDPEPIPRDVLETDAAQEVLAAGAARARGSAPSSIPRMEAAVAALAELSLLKWSGAGTSLVMHRLVAEVMRHRLAGAERRWWLEAALKVVSKYVPEEPGDVRTWVRWDPIRPHVAALVAYADVAGISGLTGFLMNQLGLFLDAKALHHEAEPLYRRALAIDEATFGPKHPAVAIRLGNLALLLRTTDRLAEAEPLFHRALAISEAAFGPEHPIVAGCLNNVAELLQDTNRLAEAEPLIRRALAIDEATQGPYHPNVAIDLHNLAELLKATNRLAEAEASYRRALAIDEAASGPEHPTVASSLINLAQLLKETNRLAEAERLFRRALPILKAAYGPDHPLVATDLNNLALLLQDTNRLTEAEPLMRRNVEILHHYAQVNGHAHPNMHTGLQNYRVLLDAMHLSAKDIAGRLQPFDSPPTEPERDTESGDPVA